MTTHDRSIMRVNRFEGAEGVDAYVAGHAALICAKAYKLFDRLDERERRRNPERLRSKDAGDIYRLMATSDPGAVREVFDAGQAQPNIADAAHLGRERLLAIREPLIDLARRHYRDVLPEDVVEDAMTDWLARFTTGA